MRRTEVDALGTELSSGRWSACSPSVPRRRHELQRFLHSNSTPPVYKVGSSACGMGCAYIPFKDGQTHVCARLATRTWQLRSVKAVSCTAMCSLPFSSVQRLLSMYSRSMRRSVSSSLISASRARTRVCAINLASSPSTPSSRADLTLYIIMRHCTRLIHELKPAVVFTVPLNNVQFLMCPQPQQCQHALLYLCRNLTAASQRGTAQVPRSINICSGCLGMCDCCIAAHPAGQARSYTTEQWATPCPVCPAMLYRR